MFKHVVETSMWFRSSFVNYYLIFEYRHIYYNKSTTAKRQELSAHDYSWFKSCKISPNRVNSHFHPKAVISRTVENSWLMHIHMCQRLPIDELNCIFYSRLSYCNSFLLFLFSTLLNSSFSLKSVFLDIFLSEKHEVPPVLCHWNVSGNS